MAPLAADALADPLADPLEEGPSLGLELEQVAAQQWMSMVVRWARPMRRTRWALTLTWPRLPRRSPRQRAAQQ